mmetsp:Transcript_16759/g.42424  ORF Transcript_16759/g.42424 Transcript_16759/m.42424 type:complete len:308 (+) Transcript_16759:590-1513(+)
MVKAAHAAVAVVAVLGAQRLPGLAHGAGPPRAAVRASGRGDADGDGGAGGRGGGPLRRAHGAAGAEPRPAAAAAPIAAAAAGHRASSRGVVGGLVVCWGRGCLGGDVRPSGWRRRIPHCRCHARFPACMCYAARRHSQPINAAALRILHRRRRAVAAPQLPLRAHTAGVPHLLEARVHHGGGHVQRRIHPQQPKQQEEVPEPALPVRGAELRAIGGADGDEHHVEQHPGCPGAGGSSSGVLSARRLQRVLPLFGRILLADDRPPQLGVAVDVRVGPEAGTEGQTRELAHSAVQDTGHTSLLDCASCR